MHKIVLNGGYGLKNFGDDALMYYCLKELSKYYSLSDVTVVCEDNEYIKKWFPDVNVATTPVLAKELYVIGGGTLFYSFSKGFSSEGLFKKLLTSLFSPKLFWSRFNKFKFQKLAKFSKANTICLGIGYGPFVCKESVSYKNAVNNVKNTHKICVRDTSSYEFARLYRDDIVLGTDICFAPDVIPVESIISASSQVKKTLSKRVGFIVRDWNNGTEADDYHIQLLQVEKDLISKGYEVTYILFSELRDIEWVTLLKKENKKFISWDPNTQTIEDFCKILVEFELFISSRFHGIIFSTILEIPSIAIRIEQKLDLVTENAVCSVWNPATSDYKQCVKLVEAAYENYDLLVEDCKKMKKNNIEKYKLMLSETLEQE
jgi:polysaccharide pyruvyl transferase WcaK-like protein